RPGADRRRPGREVLRAHRTRQRGGHGGARFRAVIPHREQPVRRAGPGRASPRWWSNSDTPHRRGAAAADHIEELITLPTVPLRDIEVHYTCSGSGPAVVFVHGLAEDHRSWQRQQRELPDYRTFAYDLRRHGATTLGAADG